VTDGLIIVDKPAGLTSHDVVSRARRLAHTRRVGHAGTLDPMATGVLVLGIDKATRLLHHLALTDKAYDATIRLGASTTTDDAEGDIVAAQSAAQVTEAQVHAAIHALTGEIMQVPSAVSAIKVDGERAYKRARAGEVVDLPARPVTVSRFDLIRLRHEGDRVDVDVQVECSSGTYVRALARDVGAALAVGGHLTALRRTRVGPFTIEQARSLDDLAALDDPVTVSMAAAVRASMPVRDVDADEVTALSYGKALAIRGIAGTHAAIGPDGTVVALLSEDGERAKPVVVFQPAG
jgi:tRNA pseudouridine55 synthase